MGSGYMWYYIYVLYTCIYLRPKNIGSRKKKNTHFTIVSLDRLHQSSKILSKLGELLGSKVCHLCSSRGPKTRIGKPSCFVNTFSPIISVKNGCPKLKGNDIYYWRWTWTTHFSRNTMELWEDPGKMLTYGSLKNSSDTKHLPSSQGVKKTCSMMTRRKTSSTRLPETWN